LHSTSFALIDPEKDSFSASSIQKAVYKFGLGPFFHPRKIYSEYRLVSVLMTSNIWKLKILSVQPDPFN